MNSRDSLRRILKSVSRSFYLSIQFLPAKIQQTIGVAYLLARASDTIADSNTAKTTSPAEHLKTFAAVLDEKLPLSALDPMMKEIQTDHPGEKALIAALPDCVTAFKKLRVWDQEQILEVMGHILKGQTNDVTLFGGEKGVQALPNAKALDEYTFLVAGSVGEFWTRVCSHHLKPYSNLAEPVLLELGRHFGQALQLVNILRDVRFDLQNGRCYLPADALLENGVSVSQFEKNPALCKDVFEKWLEKAVFLLADARDYIRAIRPARIRFACAVPYLLAKATVNLLREKSPLESDQRLKVPRSAVRRAISKAALIAFTNAALPR